MKMKLIATFLGLLILTACTVIPAEEGARPRTVEENNAITDSWYPIQSEECQLLVDSFGLILAAIGNDDGQYLLDNMDEIKSNLKMTGEIVAPRLYDLSQTTLEPSIKQYALEMIPLFVQLEGMIANDSGDTLFQVELTEKMSELLGKVPDACKS